MVCAQACTIAVGQITHGNSEKNLTALNCTNRRGLRRVERPMTLRVRSQQPNPSSGPPATATRHRRSVRLRPPRVGLHFDVLRRRHRYNRHARRVDDRSWRLRPSRKLAKRTMTGTLNCRVCGERTRHALLRDACLAEHRDYAETPTPQSHFGALDTVSLPGERVVAVVIAQPGGECTARPGRCRPDRCCPDRSMRCASKNGPPYPRR